MENPTVWTQFGFPGLIIGALFYSLWILHRAMREERREWIQAYKEQAEKHDIRQGETNACIREMTATVQMLNERFMSYQSRGRGSDR
jgi:hypothetical protein